MAKFKGLTKACEVCGSEFRVPQSHAYVKTCSTECGYQIRRVANKKDKIELKCAHCGGSFLAYPSHEDRRKYCSRACQFQSEETLRQRSANMTGERNPAWKGGATVYSVSASGRKYGRQRPHLENEKSCRRKRVKDQATPIWADLDKVKAVYAECQELSRATGATHHVDHVVPLTSKTVCGLHNEFNLQILPGAENLKKHNKKWPAMW